MSAPGIPSDVSVMLSVVFHPIHNVRAVAALAGGEDPAQAVEAVRAAFELGGYTAVAALAWGMTLEYEAAVDAGSRAA